MTTDVAFCPGTLGSGSAGCERCRRVSTRASTAGRSNTWWVTARATHMLCELEFLNQGTGLFPALPDLKVMIVANSVGNDLPEDSRDNSSPPPNLGGGRVQPASHYPNATRSRASVTPRARPEHRRAFSSWGRMWPDHIWVDMTGHDIYYSPFPVGHIAGVLPLAWFGFLGGQVVLRESFKTQSFWPDVCRYGCTATALLPMMMNWLLDLPPQADDADNPLQVVSGAPVVHTWMSSKDVLA